VEKGISLLDKGISLPDLVISAVDLPQWKPQKGMSGAGKPTPEREKSMSQPDWGLPSGDQEISRLEKGFWGGDKSTPEVEMGASGVENDNSPAIYGWDACARPAFESRKDERPVLPSLPGLDVDWERQTQP